MEEPITTFFESQPKKEHFFDQDRYASWYHEGENIKYEMVLDKKAMTVTISGDLLIPFSDKSLYEICVLFDRVSIEKETQFYGERNILVFRKDYENNKNFKSLMIVKWDNNELSVWPSIYDAAMKSLEAFDE